MSAPLGDGALEASARWYVQLLRLSPESWFPGFLPKVVFIWAEAKLLPPSVPAAGEPWRENGWQRGTLSLPCLVSLCFPLGLSGACSPLHSRPRGSAGLQLCLTFVFRP